MHVILRFSIEKNMNFIFDQNQCLRLILFNVSKSNLNYVQVFGTELYHVNALKANGLTIHF